MTELNYSFRLRAFARERTYRIGPTTLHWTDGRYGGSVPFADVDEMRLTKHGVRGLAALNKKKMWRCHLRRRSGPDVILSPLHYVRLGSWEDRSSSYLAFIEALLPELRNKNPNLKVVTEQHWTLRLRDEIKRRTKPIFTQLLVRLSTRVRDWNPHRTAVAAGGLMRMLGPWLRHHRVARANLRAAFPEKSDRDIDGMLGGVWDNFGQAMTEHLFVDQLCDDLRGGLSKSIIVEPAILSRFFELRDAGRPALFSVRTWPTANCRRSGRRHWGSSWRRSIDRSILKAWRSLSSCGREARR
jgi:hypothetical protein